MSDAREAPAAGGARRLRRVLYAAGLNPSIKFGSLEEQVALLARSFREHDALFLPLFDAPTGGAAQRAFQAAGVEPEALDLHRFSWGGLAGLLGLVRRHRVEVVHWSFYHPLNPYVFWLSALRPGVRHLMTDHNSRYPGSEPRRGVLRMAVKNRLLGRYERILCVSDFVRDSLRREGVTVPLARCTHFVNDERFRPDGAARTRLRDELDAEGRFVVLVVAHLIEEKGLEVLLRALTKLPPQVTAWIVGDGPDAPRLRAVARELALDQRVHFAGNQLRVEPYMQAADCLACPSLWAEAAGLVNLEGLACGLPLVASRVGGIPEIVDEGETGLLFEPGDAAGLAASIQQLAEAPERRARMGRAARVAALERYAARRRLGDYLDFYRAPAPENARVG